MRVSQTEIQGCCVIEPLIFSDDRGYFMESFNHRNLTEALGKEVHFVQDNQSSSHRGVLRGLHFQKGEHAQAKLVFVPQGAVQDVVVDIRKGSPTFGRHITVELNDRNKKQLFIPRGCAHGFLSLDDNTLFMYKCDNYYNKESERGIRFDDPFLGIDWRLPPHNLILSDRDMTLPFLKALGL